MRVSNHDSFSPPQQGPSPIPKTKTVFCIKSQLVSHENKFRIQPREHYYVKAVEINISECEIWGEGKTEADLVRITVIWKHHVLSNSSPCRRAVVEPCIKIWAHTGLVFVALFSIIFSHWWWKSQKPSKPLCGPKFVQYLHQENCF